MYQGIAGVVNRYYNGNKVLALLDIFPDIGLDKWRLFRKKPKGYKIFT